MECLVVRGFQAKTMECLVVRGFQARTMECLVVRGFKKNRFHGVHEDLVL